MAGTYKPDLLAYYGYYPFGMLQPGRSAPANGTLAGGYRYGFNGKEKDNNGELGLTTYDYGFRIYNSSIGRFLSVDPLTQEYPWYTPFQFAGNNPIWAVDLDGLEALYVTSRDFETWGEHLS
jgi:RHS repeat-associated protein